MGHMGSALAEGFMAGGMRPSSLILSSTRAANLASFKKRGAKVVASNIDAVRAADIVIIAVKPAIIVRVLEEISEAARGKLVVSAVAGVSIQKLKGLLDRDTRIARIMPNIPVAIGEGVVALFSKGLSRSETEELTELFRTLGLVVRAKRESDLDTFTLISGCGPGYVSALIDMVAHEGRLRGMRKSDAENIARATFQGAASYLKKTGQAPAELAAAVATKGGVTEAILGRIAKEGIPARFGRAMRAGENRLNRSTRA